jgi:hypothetical protein
LFIYDRAVQAEDVLGILNRLDAAGIEWWVDGGWGVDALLGKQTRDHRDLDLGVSMSDVPRVEQQLSEFHRIETGEWPRFLVLEDARGRRVDLAITAPAGRPVLSRGQIGHRDVRCPSLEYQFEHARGDDAAALRDGFGSPGS